MPILLEKEETAAGTASIEWLLKGIREAVLAKKPVLREILEKHGTKMLYDYAKDYDAVNVNPPVKRRQDEFITALGAIVERKLGAEIARSVEKQLEKFYYVSTADHHGPISHPFFVNSNLLIASPYGDFPESPLHNVIVLACANVSQNNSSFPRGIQFHSLTKGKTSVVSAPFFPAQTRLCPVFNFRAYTKEDIARTKKALQQKAQNGEARKIDADNVCQLISEIYEDPSAFACQTYSEQITRTNQKLWNKFFESSNLTQAPQLVYLEIEEVVAELLVQYHLYNDTTVHHMLFDLTCFPLIHEYFEGITGTFSTTEGWGTYFFWALPEGAKYRVQLVREGNTLVTPDRSFTIPLTPEGIQKGLESKVLVPSTMLNYVLLSFYYGLKCLGGFSQVNYLTFMKHAYIKMQLDRGNYKSIEVCARAQTKELVGDVTIAFMQTLEGDLAPATGIDLALFGNSKTCGTFIDVAKRISLEEGLNPLMPELYRIIYPESERDENLLTLTSEQIARSTGIENKISPCLTFPGA